MRKFDPLRAAYVELMAGTDPNMAVTLDAGLGKGMDVIKLQSRARLFFNAVQRKTYGRAWAKMPDEDWLVAVGFFEHFDSNLHLHLVVHAPEAVRDVLWDASAVWRKIRPGAHYYAELIGNQEGYRSYITKNFHIPATRDEPFIYKRER